MPRKKPPTESSPTGCDCSVCRPPEKVRRFLVKKFQRDMDAENLKAIELLTRGRKRPLH